jgi:hypothetical protein
MATDLFKEVLGAARDTAKQMAAGKKKPLERKGDDGKTVKGWTLRQYPYPSKERRFSRADGDWEETWGAHEIFLGIDGKVYEWREDQHEYGSARNGGARTDVRRQVKLCTRQQLLGLGRGKPFAMLTELLQRLPYS